MTSDDQAREDWLDYVASGSVDAEHAPYRVADFLGWQQDGSLELRPHYQRGSVWTKRDKSFLIDSLLKGYPLPLLVLQDEIHTTHPRVRRRVVDGQQRLRTLFAFIEPSLLADFEDRDDFRYTPPELEKRRIKFTFESLPDQLQNRILNTRLPTVLLDSRAGDSEVLEVYDRLNSTGLGLNAQELRYARREGRFADVSYRLARQQQARWLEWKLFREQDIARMKEVEFTSELVLLLMNGVEKTGRTEIDDAYRNEALRQQIPEEETIEQYFRLVMDALDAYLTKPQKPDSVRMFRSKGWFYALFALIMSRSGSLDPEGRPQSPLRPPAVADLASWLPGVVASAPKALAEARANDPDLVRSISGSSSDRTSRVRRLRFLESLI